MDSGKHPSIVIITYGRPAAVRSVVRFYADYPGQVVVVDGSPEPMRGFAVREGDLYLPMPGETVSRRISEGIAAVAADTCALAADDDYHVADSLLECSQTILARGDVACAAGTAVYFEAGERSPGRSVADCAVERILSVEDTADAARRFASVISLWPQVFYACMRTSVARKVSSALAWIPDGHGLVGEQLWCALPSLFGRLELVQRLQLCRSVGRRDLSAYSAPFRRLADISEWDGYARMCERVVAVAHDAGLDEASSERVVGAWREFASQTERGRRSWDARRFPLGHSLRRTARNLSSNLGVAANPKAWFHAPTRNIVRKTAGRGFLRSRAYPWADPAARHEFCRVMAFDAQASSPAPASAATP
jgi:hypothetical protein